MIRRLVICELRRAIGGGSWLPIAFFLLIAALFPFAVGPDARVLGRVGEGALWIAALTAALLPVERLVEADRVDGTLDQLALHGMSEEAVALAKIAAHWLTFGPPLMVAALPAAALLGMGGASLARAEVTLLVGTPGLAALAVAIAALTSGISRAGSIAGLLVLPLAIPLLIFAIGEAYALEGAASLLIVAGAPFVAGAAIRAART
jgi:heme exporter protein B